MSETIPNPTEAPAPSRSAATLQGALIVLCAATFIASYDSTAMSVAISAIVKDLNTTVSGVQGALAAYSLVMAACMITGAKLSGIYGAKRIFVLGVLIYGTGALVTALSPRLGVMLLGWSLLEGIGSSMQMPAALTLITHSYPPGDSRVKALGSFSAVAAVGAAAGPLIGGAITTAWTWRISFAMEFLVVLIIVSQRSRIPATPVDEPRPRLDVIGAVLSALGLALVVFGIIQAGVYGWFRAKVPFSIGGVTLIDAGSVSPVVLFVIAGLLVLVGFAVWLRHLNRRAGEPLIHLSIFSKPAVSAGLVAMAALYLVLGGSFFIVPVFVQYALSYSAFLTGVVLTPVAVMVSVGAARATVLTGKMPTRRVVSIGFALILGGTVLLALLMPLADTGWALLPGLALVGAGVGLNMALLQNLVQSGVPAEQAEEISGVSKTSAFLGQSIGTAVAGSVLIAGLTLFLTVLTNESTVLSAAQKADVARQVEQGVQVVSNAELEKYLAKVPPTTASEIIQINARARSLAMGMALFVIALAAAVALVATQRLVNRARPAALGGKASARGP